MEKQVISGNVDIKEATLEGVLQTAVCSQVGWTTDSSVLKTIVVMTDATTKCAGDGKIVLAIEPHDGECHLDENLMYRNGLELKIASSWQGVSSIVTDLADGGKNIMSIIQESRKILSEYCNNNGYLSCQKGGDRCDCNKTLEESNNQCTLPGSNSICSKKGTCECGNCKCNTIVYIFCLNGKSDGIPAIGKFCECGMAQCNYFEQKLCGGDFRGVCDCNKCKCHNMYSGGNCGEKNCENPNWNEYCIDLVKNIMCSGHGKCNCGECLCDYEYEGNFCDTKTIPYVCSDFTEYAHCFLFKKSVSGKSCDFLDYNIIVKEDSNSKFDCSYKTNTNCFIYYQFEKSMNKTLIVRVKPFNKNIDCQKPVNWLILAIVLFAVLFILGIAVIVLFFLATYLYEKHQYDKFEQEKNRTDFGRVF
ncbi:hypothetical protein MXB_160 [Myxobolus squamalis]|nr:hypothetical protein MXB_160 [Myxobolus squamalis]